MPTIFKKLEKIKPVYDWTYKIMLFICKLLLIGDIIITSVTVAGRYFPFFTAPHWGEEMVLTLMVYMAVLSATLAIRKRSHIRMTAFDKYLPKKVLLTLDLLADIAVMALGVVLLIEGLDVIKPTGNIARFAKYSSLPNLSQIWMYLPVAVAGVSMVIFELEQVFLHIEEFFVPQTEKKEEFNWFHVMIERGRCRRALHWRLLSRRSSRAASLPMKTRWRLREARSSRGWICHL